MKSNIIKNLVTQYKSYSNAYYGLSGNYNKHLRQQVVKELTGKKLPLVRCGVGAINSLLMAYYKPSGDHPRAREDQLTAIINTW